jgi:hypothetical protein
MNRFLGRFIFALILAVAAGILNYVWMQQKAPSEGYVIFKKNVEQGDQITDDMIGEIKLPLRWSDSSPRTKVYNETLLPWNARLSLLDLKAVRSFQKGELVQQIDVGAIDILPEYDILGPFRLIAVGGRFAKKYNPADSADSSDSSSSAITIAIQYDVNEPNTLDEKTRRLVQIVETEKGRRTNRQNNDQTDLRLVGIVAWAGINTVSASPLSSEQPNEQQSAPSLGLNPNELALVVPLPDLDTIPEVLLSEEAPQIGFLVPKTIVRSLDKIKSSKDSEETEESEEEQ